MGSRANPRFPARPVVDRADFFDVKRAIGEPLAVEYQQPFEHPPDRSVREQRQRAWRFPRTVETRFCASRLAATRLPRRSRGSARNIRYSPSNRLKAARIGRPMTCAMSAMRKVMCPEVSPAGV